MNLRHLEILHAVMKASSLTEAARNLNVSQPAVSTMLKHTESQLGMKLFDRSGGRLQPTPEAEALLSDLEGVFASVETFRRTAQSLKDARSGTLSVAASPTLANALLPQAIAAFRQERPHVTLHVQSLPTEQVTERVGRREIDLGLVYQRRRDLTPAQHIGRACVACVMAPDHPLARLESVTLADLAGQPIITYGPGTPFGTQIGALFRRAGQPLEVAVEVTYSLMACFLATLGAGVALVDPLLPMSGLLPGLEIRPLRPEISVDLMLLSPPGRPRSRLADAFAAKVEEAFLALDRRTGGAAAPPAPEG